MMDEILQVNSTGLPYGLSECFHCYGSTECVSQFPTDNHAGIGIRYQMQVTYVPVVKHDVGDVSRPQLIGCHRLKSVYEVLPLVVAMV